VVLNNARDPADVSIPIRANPRLPVLARCYLSDGLLLINELNPNDQTRIQDGSVQVRLPGKSGAIFRCAQSLPPHPCAEDACFCEGGPARRQDLDPILIGLDAQ
jgi:hypothetical protein